MNQIKLSFIVPFYNVEKYIAECLDSLLTQDIPYSEYEIICVNDCSPDNSRDIVLSYQKKYSNIILVEYEVNKRSGGARNTGIYAAKGKYIWFVDSDDWIEVNCISRMLELCEQDKLDVLCFNYSRVDDVGNLIHFGKSFQNSSFMEGCAFVHRYFEGENLGYHLLGYAVRALFRTDFIKDNNIYFPENIYFQDTVYFIEAITLSNRVRSLDNSYYRYRMNLSSVTSIFKNEIKGFLIFQYAFKAGGELNEFAKRIAEKDKIISNYLIRKSIWYYDSFALQLIKTSTKEKRNFYKLVNANKDFLKDKVQQASQLTKLLLIPYLGFCLSVIAKPLYLLKNKIKK